MSNSSRKENERTKLIQEKCQNLLTQMLRDEDNKYCVDCDAKGPRWASWNLGVFLCIRCAGIHRNLGVHISRVKSVNLDTWTPEQVISLQQMGNSRARAVYEAQLPDGFRRPQTDNALESFIRAKYEHKKYLAREWVPPSPPKVDWAKEIDEEIEKQKRKKKATQTGNVLGINSDKKSSTSLSSTMKTPLPAPLPKPKTSSSPKTNRIINPPPSSTAAITSTGRNHSQRSNDLLGLTSPTKPINNPGSSNGNGNSASLVNLQNDLQNDSFSDFLSATPNSNFKLNTSHDPQDNKSQQKQEDAVSSVGGSTVCNVPLKSSLAKDEEDFFNQTSFANEKDKSGKLSMDRILALYASPPQTNPHNHQQQQFMSNQIFGNNFSATQQQSQQYSSTLLINPSAGGGTSSLQYGQTMNFTGMSPSFIGGPPQQQQQHQFMTPPNSASMYNAPVMTAPAAFTSPAGIAYHSQMASAPTTGFAQFPTLQQGTGSLASGGFPQSQFGMLTMSNASSQSHQIGSNSTILVSAPVTGSNANLIGLRMPMQVQPTATVAPSNLNQQFGNLNIGNVWQ